MLLFVDWTINLGQIVTIATVLLAGVGLFFGLRERVTLLEARVAELETDLREVTRIQMKNLEEYLPILAQLTLKVLNGKQN